MARKELPPLTDAQVEIMNIVWDNQPCSVADVWRILNEIRSVSRNTVHTVMIRLEEKAWLTRETDGSQVLFQAAVTQQKSQRQTVRRLVDSVFGGSIEELVLTLLNDPTVSSEEASRIQRLITEAKKGKQK